MRGSELVEALSVAIDHLVHAPESMSALDRAIETIVGRIGQFTGKDTTSYVETYQVEMKMRDIRYDMRLFRFPQVVTPSIHSEVLDIHDDCWNWLESEG